MSDHYDGVSEPMSRAEKEAMRRDEADYDALAARLAEAERLLREVVGDLDELKPRLHDRILAALAGESGAK